MLPGSCPGLLWLLSEPKDIRHYLLQSSLKYSLFLPNSTEHPKQSHHPLSVLPSPTQPKFFTALPSSIAFCGELTLHSWASALNRLLCKSQLREQASVVHLVARERAERESLLPTCGINSSCCDFKRRHCEY